MKYRDLNLTFPMEDVTFTVLSISNELMVQPIPKHSHSRNSYELHYISYGYGTLIADDVRYEVTPGTFYMTGPGVFHEQVSRPDEPMREYGAYLKVNLPRRGTASPLLSTFLDRLFWFGPADIEIYELMKKLIAELEQRPEGSGLMLSALLQQLIIRIAREYDKTAQSKTAGDATSRSRVPDDRTYLTIEEAFLYNYRDLTLESLAALLGLSNRQTERLLIKHYNKTFQQKKKEARMSAACILLQSGEQSIASIAEELGYSSPEHFAHAFKNYYHMPPSAYTP